MKVSFLIVKVHWHQKVSCNKNLWISYRKMGKNSSSKWRSNSKFTLKVEEKKIWINRKILHQALRKTHVAARAVIPPLQYTFGIHFDEYIWSNALNFHSPPSSVYEHPLRYSEFGWLQTFNRSSVGQPELLDFYRSSGLDLFAHLPSSCSIPPAK